jgi:hypothetical protein
MRFRYDDDLFPYNAVINTFKRAGFKKTSNSAHWNIYWGRHMSEDDYRDLLPFQVSERRPRTHGAGSM